MTRSLIALAALVLLGACANPLRDPGAADPALGGGGLGGGAAAASDPTSPAFFRERVGDRVLFAVDQSTLSPEARQILTAQAGWLAQNPSYAIVIEGHADEQGTRDYNLALGARRAAAAQEFLLAQGIAPGRVRTVTYGKERPIEICSTEACYAQNRRAVTVVAGAGAGV